MQRAHSRLSPASPAIVMSKGSPQQAQCGGEMESQRAPAPEAERALAIDLRGTGQAARRQDHVQRGAADSGKGAG
jgi:hypothetical protein